MLTANAKALSAHAEALAGILRGTLEGHDAQVRIECEAVDDAVGAGSLPTVALPGFAVTLQQEGVEAGLLSERLRAAATPVFSTVQDGRVWLHVRTLRDGDFADVQRALLHALDLKGDLTDGA